MTEAGEEQPSAAASVARLLREIELTRASLVRLATSGTDWLDGEPDELDGVPSDGPTDGPADGPVGDAAELAELEERLLVVLTAIRRAVLSHPAEARAVVGLLVAEGRRYAATETGAQRYAAMADSAQVERLQVIWDKVSLNLLDDLVDDEAVPVAWVDLVRDLAAGSGLDRLADRLRPFGLA